MTDEPEADAALFPVRAGDKLRAARLAAGMDLADIATKTRVPLRHLQAIEASDYDSLPSATYCVGFVKAFARAVGADEVGLASQLRGELGQRPAEERYEPQFVEDDATGSAPSRNLVLTALGILALLVAGYFVVRGMSLTPDEPQSVAKEGDAGVAAGEEDGNAAGTADANTPPDPKGQVVLTAKEVVWLRIYDAADKVIFEKEMQKGERFAVPPEANKPMIRTGRADLIGVTVGGKEVAPR
jgi:cytoskeleton protein RodZ